MPAAESQQTTNDQESSILDAKQLFLSRLAHLAAGTISVPREKALAAFWILVATMRCRNIAEIEDVVRMEAIPTTEVPSEYEIQMAAADALKNFNGIHEGYFQKQFARKGSAIIN